MQGISIQRAEPRTLVLLSLAWLAHFSIWLVNATWFDDSLRNFIVFDYARPYPSLFEFTLQCAYTLSAIVMILFIPGLMAWRFVHGRSRDTFEEVIGAFLTSILIGFFTTTLIRASSGDDSGVDRVLFTFATALISFLFSAFMTSTAAERARPQTLRDKEKIALVVYGTVLCIVMAGLLLSKLILESMSHDEQEAFEFARSLSHFDLPYWDTEVGNWGFYTRFMLHAYPNFFLMLGLGESSFAVRMLYFVSLVVSYCACVAMTDRILGRLPRITSIILMLATMALITIVAAYYNSWHPYVSGLAEPSGVDMFGFALFVSALYFLFCRRYVLFLGASLAHYAALPNGAAYSLTVLFLAWLFSKKDRRPILQCTGAYAVSVGLYHLACWALFGRYTQPTTTTKQFSFEHYLGYVETLASPLDSLLFLTKIAILSCGAVVLFLHPLKRDEEYSVRLLKWFVLAQLAVSMLFTNLHHIHYHLSLMLLVLTLGIVQIERMKSQQRLLSGVALASITSAWLVTAWPRNYIPLENGQALGNVTSVRCTDQQIMENYTLDHYFGTEWFPFEEYGTTLANLIYYGSITEPENNPKVIFSENADERPHGYSELARNEQCKILKSDEFDEAEFIPRYSYRQELAWNILSVGWLNNSEDPVDRTSSAQYARSLPADPDH